MRVCIIIFFYKSHICEKSFSWDTDQNVIGKSGCRIFKATVTLKKMMKNRLIFCMSIQAKVDLRFLSECGQK